MVDLTAVTTRDDFLLELGECLAGRASVHPVETFDAALSAVAGTKRGQVLVLDARDLMNVKSALERARAESRHAVVLVFGSAELDTKEGDTLEDAGAFALLPIPLDKARTGAALESAMAEALSRKAEAGVSPSALSVEPFRPADGGGPPDTEPDRTRLRLGAVIAAVAVASGVFLYVQHTHKAAPPASPAGAVHPQATKTEADNAAAASATAETSIVSGTVDELLEKARLAMRERRYSEPAGDNALLYYRSAVAADAANGEALDGLQRVGNVLAARFQDAVGAGRLDEAAGTLASFRSAIPQDTRLGSFSLRLLTAQISKALADGSVDRAAALLRAAQQSGYIPADQINRWRQEIGRHQEEAKAQKLASLVTDRIRDGKLSEPAEDSAKLYLQQLRDVSAGGALTQRAIHDLDMAYLRKAREAALAGHSQEQEHWLSEAKASGVTAQELTAFQRDLVNSRQKALAAESDRLAVLARDRMRGGRLTDPQDSATSYLTQIQSADPGYSSLPQLTHELAARLLDRARSAAQNSKAAAVDADLGQAKRWGADAKDILAVQQLQTSSAAAAAAARAAAVDPASLAAGLKRLRYKAPDYPTRALTENLTGSVIVEYTVDANGNPRDVHATQGTPPGVFDHAAISAVKRWHYQPAVVDGMPVEVPMKTSIRFELPK
ncbi:MAG TPA: energy transducer TonB [Steroidobacteraceae bacterium]